MSRFARVIILLWAGLVMPCLSARQSAAATEELVYVDGHGVIRWKADQREVALFGANYCLPSASDYRAAGYVNADRKKLIEQDMAHFARMGFDGVRVCLWGDYENSDAQGNLIVNDHLDVMDYLIAEAAKRGLYMLFTPMVTYSSLWPDLREDKSVVGFSTHFKKSELGTNPDAIAAQENYLRQILNHVNPYTGLAIKDEPNILFIEMINEPWHHSDDRAGSIKYINALVEAVRSTGCQKLTFHNLSQDFGMAKPIGESNVDGLSIAWYPSGLNANRQLHGNFLRFLDDYPPMRSATIPAKPRIVYEFDLPDVISGYHYPAMARDYRQVGAQFAAMFSYDMLATAPYNLGWHTHLLNLIYTPQKAASAIIAAQVMRDLPRGAESYGAYPANCRFGDFRVSYDQDLSELVTSEKFMYSNNTQTTPPSPAKLRKIVGFGSSPIVQYEGQGVYFLDKIDDGHWRLEVYPDSIQVDDPFHAPNKDAVKFRLVSRSWPIKLSLPDLGDSFNVTPLNEGNSHETRATGGRFQIVPGAYLLATGRANGPLPESVAGVKLREFVCPQAAQGKDLILVTAPREHVLGEPLKIQAIVVTNDASSDDVTVQIPTAGNDVSSIPMTRVSGYHYAAEVPPVATKPGKLKGKVVLRTGGGASSTDFTVELVPPTQALRLFDAGSDVTLLDESRVGWAPNPLVAGDAPDTKAVGFGYAADAKWVPEDLTRSLLIGDRIACRAGGIGKAQSLAIKIRGKSDASVVHVVLVNEDGAAWETRVACDSTWRELDIPLNQFNPTKWALLPQAFPNGMSYWSSLDGAEKLDPTKLERLQFSLRKADLGSAAAAQSGVEIQTVSLRFKGSW